MVTGIKWEDLEKRIGIKIPRSVKNFGYFRMEGGYTEKWKMKYVTRVRKKIIWGGYDDFENIYEIYEIPEAYLVHVVGEYMSLGSPEADYVRNRWVFSEKEWIGEEKILYHWEDGNHKYIYFPESRHMALYLMGKKKPEGAIRWRDNEYTDYEGWQPHDEEYVIVRL